MTKMTMTLNVLTSYIFPGAPDRRSISVRLLCAFEIAPARKPWFLEMIRTSLAPGIRSPTRR